MTTRRARFAATPPRAESTAARTARSLVAASACAAIVCAVTPVVAAADLGPSNRPAGHTFAGRVVAAGAAERDSPRSTDSGADPYHYVGSAEWIPDPNGRRLAVYPSEYGRYHAPASEWPAAWDEVVALAPDVDLPHMRDQFRCHVEYARIAEPEKPSWNLEMWRDDVGYVATVLGQCNP